MAKKVVSTYKSIEKGILSGAHIEYEVFKNTAGKFKVVFTQNPKLVKNHNPNLKKVKYFDEYPAKIQFSGFTVEEQNKAGMYQNNAIQYYLDKRAEKKK